MDTKYQMTWKILVGSFVGTHQVPTNDFDRVVIDWAVPEAGIAVQRLVKKIEGNSKNNGRAVETLAKSADRLVSLDSGEEIGKSTNIGSHT